MSEFRETLADLQISQVNLGRLIGVTPRTINDWVQGRTKPPSTVMAYLKLLRRVPGGLRREELDSSREETPSLDTGMYGVRIKGPQGTARGIMLFRDGRITGVNQWRGRYDGRYVGNAGTGQVDITLHCVIPKGVQTTLEGITPEKDVAFDLETSVPPRRPVVMRHFDTDFGAIDVDFFYIRELPE